MLIYCQTNLPLCPFTALPLVVVVVVVVVVVDKAASSSCCCLHVVSYSYICDPALLLLFTWLLMLFMLLLLLLSLSWLVVACCMWCRDIFLNDVSAPGTTVDIRNIPDREIVWKKGVFSRHLIVWNLGSGKVSGCLCLFLDDKDTNLGKSWIMTCYYYYLWDDKEWPK